VIQRENLGKSLEIPGHRTSKSVKKNRLEVFDVTEMVKYTLKAKQKTDAIRHYMWLTERRFMPSRFSRYKFLTNMPVIICVWHNIFFILKAKKR
jgi:hypothetical protein